MRKSGLICLCESNSEDNISADQRLYFRDIDRVIPVLSKSESSSL